MIDAKRVDDLARVLRSNGLTRLRLEEAGEVIELECAPVVAATSASAPLPAGVAGVADATLPGAPSAADAVALSPADEGAMAATIPGEDGLEPDQRPLDLSKVATVTAPMVGVFYAAPSPGAEPFVHVGSKVRKGDTLCVIEAMKLMNEVVAERDGEVIDVCVGDGELVEFGCTLMKLC